MWADKSYETDVPRYVQWLGRVQVSRVVGRTPNLIYKHGEYEQLLSSLQDIDVKVKIEGMTVASVDVCNRKSFIVYTIYH